MRRSVLFSLALSLFLASGCADEVPPRALQAGLPPGMTQAQWGERLFAARGCTGCHSIVGARNVGPPLDGLVGTERDLVDGSKRSADLAYLRSALVSPSSAIPLGYEDEMPSYGSLLDDEEIDAVIAYLGTL